MKCVNCRFWNLTSWQHKDGTPVDGDCRIRPPTLNNTSLLDELKDTVCSNRDLLYHDPNHWMFPATDADSWCGEFQPKEEAKEPSLLTACKELLEICRFKCSPSDEVILRRGKTNEQAMIDAMAAIKEATGTERSAASPEAKAGCDEAFGDLIDYMTGAYMSPATKEQRDASIESAKHDGGAGVILVDSEWRVVRADEDGADNAVRCYVIVE